MLVYCWSGVVDGQPTLKQHCLSLLYLLVLWTSNSDMSFKMSIKHLYVSFGHMHVAMHMYKIFCIKSRLALRCNGPRYNFSFFIYPVKLIL